MYILPSFFCQFTAQNLGDVWSQLQVLEVCAQVDKAYHCFQSNILEADQLRMYIYLKLHKKYAKTRLLAKLQSIIYLQVCISCS